MSGSLHTITFIYTSAIFTIARLLMLLLLLRSVGGPTFFLYFKRPVKVTKSRTTCGVIRYCIGHLALFLKWFQPPLLSRWCEYLMYSSLGTFFSSIILGRSSTSFVQLDPLCIHTIKTHHNWCICHYDFKLNINTFIHHSHHELETW